MTILEKNVITRIIFASQIQSHGIEQRSYLILVVRAFVLLSEYEILYYRNRKAAF